MHQLRFRILFFFVCIISSAAIAMPLTATPWEGPDPVQCPESGAPAACIDDLECGGILVTGYGSTPAQAEADAVSRWYAALDHLARGPLPTSMGLTCTTSCEGDTECPWYTEKDPGAHFEPSAPEEFATDRWKCERQVVGDFKFKFCCKSCP